jgi:hypothetical protein
VGEDVGYVVLLVGDVMDTVGRVVSGLVYVTIKESVPALPAASIAVTVMTFAPDMSGTPERLQFAVPVATPLPPRSLDHRTCVTPTLSDAVPLIVIVAAVADQDVPVVGAAIVAVGRVVSGAE